MYVVVSSVNQILNSEVKMRGQSFTFFVYFKFLNCTRVGRGWGEGGGRVVRKNLVNRKTIEKSCFLGESYFLEKILRHEGVSQGNFDY